MLIQTLNKNCEMFCVNTQGNPSTALYKPSKIHYLTHEQIGNARLSFHYFPIWNFNKTSNKMSCIQMPIYVVIYSRLCYGPNRSILLKICLFFLKVSNSTAHSTTHDQYFVTTAILWTNKYRFIVINMQPLLYNTKSYPLQRKSVCLTGMSHAHHLEVSPYIPQA